MASWDSDDSDEISEPWDDDTLSTTATCGETDDDEEAQDVIRCDICDNTDPKLYCNTCTKSLCKRCTGEHASSETVTKHDIVRFQYRNQMPSVINCARHQLFTCELFCKKCKTMHLFQLSSKTCSDRIVRYLPIQNHGNWERFGEHWEVHSHWI